MRYLIGFLVTIGLIVLVLVLLFRGGGAPSTPTSALSLPDYVNSSSVARLVIKGPTVADSQHQAVEIDVTASQVTINVYSGYENEMTSSHSYDNTTAAYNEFLHALQRQNFTKGDDDASFKDDTGRCSQGDRYIFSFSSNDKQLMRYWSSSCGVGNSKSITHNVLNLFERQVPDYAAVTTGLKLDSDSYTL